jgi:hypothetical protein
MTLAAHVALRLPRCWYFSATDVALTLNAVTLLRVMVQHLIGVCPREELVAHLAGKPNPGSTSNAEVDGVTFHSLVVAVLDFLARGKVNQELVELHTQVATLALVLLSTQLTHTDLLQAAGEAVPGRSYGDMLLQSPDAALSIALAAGRELLPATPYGSDGKAGKPAPPVAPAFPSTPSRPGAAAPTEPLAPSTPAVSGGAGGSSPPTTRAAALVSALLRNIATQAGSDEDESMDPDPDSTATTASDLLVDAWKAVSAESGIPTSGPSSSTAAAGALAASGSAGGSVLGSVLSAIALPVTLATSAFTHADEPLPCPLAERSALLLLVLVHNARSGMDAPVLRLVNPYRDALVHLTNADVPKDVPVGLVDLPRPPSTPADLSAAAAAADTVLGASNAASASYSGLFKALRRMCIAPLGTGLLYTLLHGCPAFSDAFLSRSDVDEVVVPLLRQALAFGTLHPRHRYILLITLLLFSKDTVFASIAHRRIKLPPKATAWFTEQLLGEVTLGSLMIILLARILLHSSFSLSPPTAGDGAATTAGYGNDTTLHSNSLAVMANLAANAVDLHPYAAQRLVGLLVMLAKRYRRVSVRLAVADGVVSGTQVVSAAGGRPGAPALTPAQATATVAYLTPVLEHLTHCLGVLIELLLACCDPTPLPSNVSVVYNLLREREALEGLAADPAFSDGASALLDIVAHFQSVVRVEAGKRADAQPGSGTLALTAAAPAPPPAPAPFDVNSAVAAAALASPGAAAPRVDATPSSSAAASAGVVWEEEDVVEVLTAAARVWRGGASAAEAAASLRETKFAYEEDTSPDLFFVPFAWALAVDHTPDCDWAAWATAPAAPMRLVQWADTRTWVVGPRHGVSAPTAPAAAPAGSHGGGEGEGKRVAV